MAYQTPTTIKSAIEKIKKKKFVLPSIQREFVWSTEQVEMLFDSLMRDYPISTFLFWEVDRSSIANFQFYEFLKKYHERDCRHNQKAEFESDENIIALLDGQQRLTSIYLALQGSYASKIPRVWANNPKAYPEKKMYLNLLEPSDELEMEYDFKFLTSAEADNGTDMEFWFPCSEILKLDDMAQVSMYLMKNGLMDTSQYSAAQSEFAIKTLNEFYNVVHQKGTISYYLERGEELDKVLQIFIRINSGGTKLSYSDLLLSIATAQWQERDAREVIHQFVDEINGIGSGFTFNKDFVLKACLVLADLKDIKFKVDNFNAANMALIEQKWEAIADAIRIAVSLIAKLGYNSATLASTNTAIPIAYFIYKNKLDEKLLHSANQDANRRAIREWLARALLKGVFGGQPDSIYPSMRNLINKHNGRFPTPEIIEHYKGSRKSISFTEDDIDNILESQYGKAKAYCALTLLYPALNHDYQYHQDHIHPKTEFTKAKLRKRGYAEETIDKWLADFNKLPNLQLMQATTNTEKNAKPFAAWLAETHPNENEQQHFLRDNHIETDQSLLFDDFQNFYALRKATIKRKLLQALNITSKEDR